MKQKTIQAKRLSPIFERNTAQVNRSMANILMYCFGLILLMVLLSAVGFFEFGKTYTLILLIVGLFVCLTPEILVHFLPTGFMKYYMAVTVAIFVGIIGADKNIGVSITYALVPIMSCLYFEPEFVLKTSLFSYVVMIASEYLVSANMAEVLYQGRPRMQMFLAYAAGYTIEYVIVVMVLYCLVKRAKSLAMDVSSAELAQSDAEKERQIFNALCVDYTAAYCCDLMNDTMEVIKQKRYSHSAHSEKDGVKLTSYSEWIRYCCDHVIVKEMASEFSDIFEANALMQRLKREKSFSYRHRTFPNDIGMEYFEATVVLLYEDAHSFRVIMGYRPIDDLVAEEKKQQAEMKKALLEAKRANQAKTDFLRRMSHDIRTPLNGLIGLINIDEMHFDDAALIRANHDKMLVSANHLLSLINDVLQMSKLEDGAVELAHEPISLMELTRDIIAILTDRATEAGITWEYEKGKKIIPYPYIYGSPLHLRQIFLNIYGNCIKYNRPGGKVCTIVESLGDHDGICSYRWIITDTGVGMSKEFIQHIFEPFAQEKIDARSVYEGTGLGMSIVKKLVDQMGGTISVTSEEGVGSRFVIELSFEIAPAPAEKTLPTAQEHSVRGLHLMVAEDNALNAEIITTLLSDQGAEITVAENGQRAVELFRANPAGTFDAILMDMMMPVMDGLTATRTIRALERPDAKQIPIIAMTANAFDEDAHSCLEAGMNAHLAKPLQIDNAIATIASYCRTDT